MGGLVPCGFPENNATLDEVRLLIGNRELDVATSLASRLIARSPKFAEAYNQRAIALFIQGRFAESAEDCQRVSSSIPIISVRSRGWRSARCSSISLARR